MAIALSALVEEVGRYLDAARIQDYCPSGLRVEGRPQMRRIVSGVAASQALLDAAVEAGADVALVHHGYFWEGENPCVVGMKQRRLGTLLNNDISLLVYYPPLDLHPEVDNNVQLTRQLGFEAKGPLEPDNPCSIVPLGSLAEPMQPADFARHVRDTLGCEPLPVDTGQSTRRIAWCTGGAQGYVDQAIAAGVDVYLIGEVSERTVHSARGNGTSFTTAGHHTIERHRAQALDDYLDKHFAIEYLFIDCPNPA